MAKKPVTKRAVPFTRTEENCILHHAEMNMEILVSKGGTKVIKERKQKVWVDIANKLNRYL